MGLTEIEMAVGGELRVGLPEGWEGDGGASVVGLVGFPVTGVGDDIVGGDITGDDIPGGDDTGDDIEPDPGTVTGVLIVLVVAAAR